LFARLFFVQNNCQVFTFCISTLYHSRLYVKTQGFSSRELRTENFKTAFLWQLLFFNNVLAASPKNVKITLVVQCWVVASCVYTLLHDPMQSNVKRVNNVLIKIEDTNMQKCKSCVRWGIMYNACAVSGTT
jgi:hypothetical protein